MSWKFMSERMKVKNMTMIYACWEKRAEDLEWGCKGSMLGGALGWFKRLFGAKVIYMSSWPHELKYIMQPVGRNTIEGLKYLKLTMNAMKCVLNRDKPVIYVASGQHHIAALEQYQTILSKAKQESLKGLWSLEKKQVVNVDEMEIDEENTNTWFKPSGNGTTITPPSTISYSHSP